jgi:hypothetical protein
MSPRRFFLRSIVLGPVAALVLCSAVSATIVPGKSIAGVSLGDGQARVRSQLGPPPHVQLGQPGSGVVRWDYTARNHLTVLFGHGRVTSVFVSAIPHSGRVFEHTKKGIGLGSPMSAVERAYPGHCDFPDPGMGAPPSCSFGRMLFMVSGRYGMGRNAPVETIELQPSP